MPGISDILNIGLSTLTTSRDAIALTGENIANANTPGYHRRSPDIRSLPGITDHRGSFGRGAEIAEVRRIRNQYAEAQALRAVQAQGGADAARSTLAEVEGLFTDLNGAGVSEILNRFFNAFADLANNPQGSAERAGVLATGQELAGALSRLASELRVTRSSVDQRAQTAAADVNALAERIAGLNKEIQQAEAAGGEAGGLRDQRDQLLKDLGGKTSFNAYEDPETGNLNVLIGGQPLVSGYKVSPLQAVSNAATGVTDFYIVDGAGQRLEVSSQLTGGELAGLLETRDKVVVGLRTSLDRLAYDLANRVNAVHAAGRGLDGTQNDFFAPPAALQGAAENLAVNAVVAGDPSKIAAGLTAAAGDNENALALAALRSAKFMAGGTQTADQFYRSVVAEVGTAARAANLEYKFQDDILTQLEAEAQAVSGVSLDEEAANLLKFQQSFQAAARLIGVSDDMMKTVLQLV